MAPSRTALRHALGLLLCLATLTPNAVSAQDSQAFDRSDPMNIYREAGADEQQQQKIRDLGKAFEASARVKSERIKNLLKRMHEQSLQADPDEKTVMSIQDEINSTTNEMASLRIKMMLQVRQVLTPEQKVHLIELLKMQEKMHPVSPGN